MTTSNKTQSLILREDTGTLRSPAAGLVAAANHFLAYLGDPEDWKDGDLDIDDIGGVREAHRALNEAISTAQRDGDRTVPESSREPTSPAETQGMGEDYFRPHKLMTRKEYNAITLKGVHTVVHNYDGGGNTAIWYSMILPEPQAAPDLHPNTAALVSDFMAALAAKLFRSQEKYGYRDGWLTQDWQEECRQHLMQHIAKGDPLDVAAYCAFMWKRGWSTATPAQPVSGDGEAIKDILRGWTIGAFTGWEGKSGDSTITLDEAEEHFQNCMLDMLENVVPRILALRAPAQGDGVRAKVLEILHRHDDVSASLEMIADDIARALATLPPSMGGERGKETLESRELTAEEIQSMLDAILPQPALEQLRDHQQQLDQDGIMVGVSRQALEELLAVVLPKGAAPTPSASRGMEREKGR